MFDFNARTIALSLAVLVALSLAAEQLTEPTHRTQSVTFTVHGTDYQALVSEDRSLMP